MIQVAVLILFTARILLSSAQSPAESLFEVDLWPGEGVPVFETTGRQITLRARPSRAAAPLRATVQPKRRLHFDATRFMTFKAGRFVALRDARISGRTLGAVRRLSKSEYYDGDRFPQQSIAVARGDGVEYLQYRAEGTCFVRIGARTIDADPCPAQQEMDFRLETEPVVEWWIHVLLDNGVTGWVLATDPAVKHVKREF